MDQGAWPFLYGWCCLLTEFAVGGLFLLQATMPGACCDILYASIASPAHASMRLSPKVVANRSNFCLDGTLSSSVRDMAGRPNTRFSTCPLHSHRSTLMSRALDDHQNRYAQRPRVCICLGAGSRSSHLVSKPIKSTSLARSLAHTVVMPMDVASRC